MGGMIGSGGNLASDIGLAGVLRTLVNVRTYVRMYACMYV